MEVKNTKAKYLLTGVSFEHEEAHLAYTLGTGAASQKNDPYILKADDNISEEDKQLVEDILKSEGDLPNSAFAYVPDKDKTSTRKLRIDDARHTALAVAALGKGMMGNKVEIPEKDLPAVKRKVKAAYKKFYPDKEVPDILKSVEVDALSVSDKLTADNGTTHKDTIVEKVEITPEQWAQFQEMQKSLEAFQAKEQADIKKSKEDIVKSAGFIGDEETVVELLLKSEDSAIVEEIIVKAVEAINKAKEEAIAEAKVKIDELEASLKESKGDLAKAKEDFAKPEGLEGGNKSQKDDQDEIAKSDALSAFIENNQELLKSL